MIDEKKLIEAITKGEYTTGNILADMELQQFIKDFPKIGEWIPCSERLPKMGQDVIVTDMITGEATIAYLNTLNCFVFEDGRGHEVSAWQPLPEPYKE